MKFLTALLFTLGMGTAFAQYSPNYANGTAFLPITVTMEKNSANGVTIDDVKASIVSFLGEGPLEGPYNYQMGVDLGSYKARQVLTEAGAFKSQSIEILMARMIHKYELNNKIVISVELYWGFGKGLKNPDRKHDFDVTNYENFVNANCVDCSETEYNSVVNSDSGIKISAEYKRLKLTLFTNRYTHSIRGENASPSALDSDYIDWSFDAHSRIKQNTKGVEISYLAIQKQNFSIRPFVKYELTSTTQEMFMHDHRPSGSVPGINNTSVTPNRSVFSVGVKFDVNLKPKKK